jgi:hypothetical protein
MKSFIFATCVGVAVLSTGCKDERSKTETSAGAPGESAPAATQQASNEHKRRPIGEMTISGLKLVATMDEPVKPGQECAFYVMITGGKPKAVRFWIGNEGGEGSVKAKAEEETTDDWHSHVEVPDPLPPDSKFWVEVEPPSGETFKASFALKMQ